jgi:photosystem II stability/assembly factor-like uncharacterized protein
MKKIVKYCGLTALVAGAAFCLPNCDGDDGTGPAPYDGPWKIVPCPEGPSYLKGVFFLNPNQGYAVGCRHILKYEGAEWKIDFAYKENSERYIVALEDVWFNAPDDGWVAGHEYDTEKKVSTALLLRYDGNEWKRANHGTPATGFEALYFLSPNEGWAVGFGICHWDGSNWEYVSDLTRIVDVYFNSSNDGWAVGYYDERIYHYDGATWTRVHDDPWGIKLNAISFTSQNHGWAGGWGVIADDQSNVMEYKSGKWGYYLEPPWDEGIRRDINAVHFSDPNNGWAVGQTTFRWDGERWWYVEPPPRSMHRSTLNDVFTLSENDAWAVGGVTILHYKP